MELTPAAKAAVVDSVKARLLLGVERLARENVDRYGPVLLICLAMYGVVDIVRRNDGQPEAGPWASSIGAFGPGAVIDRRGTLRTNYCHPPCDKRPKIAYPIGQVDNVATLLSGTCDGLGFSQADVEEVFAKFKAWIRIDDRQTPALPRELIDRDKRSA